MAKRVRKKKGAPDQATGASNPSTSRFALGAFAGTWLQEAIEQFQKALQNNPNDAKARDSLAKLQQFEMQQNAPGKH